MCLGIGEYRVSEIHPYTYISCSVALCVSQVRLQYYKVFEDVKLSAAVHK